MSNTLVSSQGSTLAKQLWQERDGDRRHIGTFDTFLEAARHVAILEESDKWDEGWDAVVVTITGERWLLVDIGDTVTLPSGDEKTTIKWEKV